MATFRDQSPLRRLVGYCREHRAVVAIGFVTSVVGSAALAGIPLVVKQIVDERSNVGPWLGLLAAAALLRFAAGTVRRYVSGKLGYGVGARLRTDVFDALQRLDGAQYDRLKAGQVVGRVVTDVGSVETALRNLPQLASNAVMFALSLVIMLTLSPLLTLVALVAAPLLFVSARRGSAFLTPLHRDYSQQTGVLAGVVESAVSGVRVIKGFGQEHREQERFERQAHRLYDLGVRRANAASNFYPALNAIPAIAQVAVLAFGGWLALDGRITLGTFLAFATYLAATVAPVRWLVTQLPALVEAKAGLLRLLEVIDAEPTVTDKPDAQKAPDGPLSIDLEHVTFGYDHDYPVLHDVTLHVEAGETLALVGAPGSGKSTIAMLLTRFYEPQRGMIRLNGIDLADLTTESVRERVAMVFEDSFLFSDTLRANIAFGRADARVAEAARLAEADAFIDELPDGYDTVVGERGLTLSGGQRQRVALARAMLTAPPILVLDDATSAVDAGVEADILATLRQATRNRTTLLIAHRRSSLRLADRIAVLDRGRVVDVGTHAELLARCPYYRALLHNPADFPHPNGVLQRGKGMQNPSPVREVRADSGQADSGQVDGGQVDGGPVDGGRADGGQVERAREAEPRLSARKLLGPLWASLALVVAAMGIESVANLALPLLTRSAIDNGVGKEAPGVLVQASVAALALVLLTWAIRVFHERVVGRTGEQARLWLEVKAFAHLQRLGLDYYEREHSGAVLTRMTSDVSAITSFIQRSFGTLVTAVAEFTGVLIVMLVLQPRLTLALVVLLPPFVASVVVYRRWSRRAYDEARDRLSELNTDLQENIAGLRVAQAYGRQDASRRTFRQLVDQHLQARLRSERYLAVFTSFTELVGDLALVVILAFGAALVAGGDLTTGGLIAFVLYINLLFGPVQLMTLVIDSYQRAQVGLERLRELLSTETSTPQTTHPLDVERATDAITFDGVHFTYQGAAREAVSGIELEIAQGETVAVVGETGAGKSTLLKLMARFYDPTRGAITLGGTDLRQLDLASYRSRLGIVPQEPYLFAGTVRDAIAYGRPHATDHQVEEAARAVGAHDMIATLRHDYSHELGEGGKGISAGQRQLLALARAQLVDPDVLLLDEAMSTLDLATEAAVTEAIRSLTKPRTTLIIAHRLSTAMTCDRILVMASGRIAEAGTHEELLGSGGRYARLWDAFSGVRGTRHSLFTQH